MPSPLELVGVSKTPAGGRAEFYKGHIGRAVLSELLPNWENVSQIYGIEGATGLETVVEYGFAPLPLAVIDVMAAEQELEPLATVSNSQNIAAD